MISRSPSGCMEDIFRTGMAWRGMGNDDDDDDTMQDPAENFPLHQKEVLVHTTAAAAAAATH